MGCNGCNSSNVPNGCKNNGYCLTQRCNQKTTLDLLANIHNSNNIKNNKSVEVSFKNGRKSFYKSNNLDLKIGQKVVVEAENGFDIGMISLKGELVTIQMRLYKQKETSLKIIRVANEKDINVWLKFIKEEEKILLKSRSIIKTLQLNMKISDIEYQADGQKINFYYLANKRVDFRELIKILAKEFKSRIQMVQIGSRQESAKIGGIGDCGRELCCSTWIKDFRAVNISAARYQQLSINPEKLTGKCGKLKCCLNYELDSYLQELKKFPDFKLKLISEEGKWIFQKADIFSNKLYYYLEGNFNNQIELDLKMVNEVINSNKQGIKNSISSILKTKKNQNQVEIHDKIDRFDNIQI